MGVGETLEERDQGRKKAGSESQGLGQDGAVGLERKE